MGLNVEYYTGTPVLVGSGAYSAGDVVGTLLTLPCSQSGIIKGCVITDKDKQSAATDVIVFRLAPTVAADNAAFDPAAADLLNVVAMLKVVAGDYSIFANNSVANSRVTDQPFVSPVQGQNGARNLFVVLVTRGTPTYASVSSVQFSLIVQVDLP